MRKWILLGAFFFLVLVLVWVGRQEEKKVLNYKVTAWQSNQTADCAIVLTGGPGRIREGFDLLEQGRVKKLIISGVNPTSTLYQIFPQLPAYYRISESDVVLEKRSGTTYGNAVQSEALVGALNCRSALLVTSALHMYRSYSTFRSRFPAEVQLKPHGIISGDYKPQPFEIFVEVVKSLFYSLWAY